MAPQEWGLGRVLTRLAGVPIGLWVSVPQKWVKKTGTITFGQSIA